MANYATLKAGIQQYIKENHNNDITGNLLQQQLLAMINSLGVGYQYIGIATPTTNPGTPDQNVFYIASTDGTYTNFGGIVLADGEIAILKYNGAWAKDLTGAATIQKTVEKSFSANLLDINADDVSLAHILNPQGQEVANATYNISGFIPIEGGQTYSCTNEMGLFSNACFFDANKDFIGGSYSYNPTSVTAPNNAAYVRVSVDTDVWQVAGLAKTASKFDYVQYSPVGGYYAKPLNHSVTDDALNSNKVNNTYDAIIGLQVTNGANLFDESAVETGKLVNNSGNIASASGWAISGYIPVTAGQNYYITAKYIARQKGLQWCDSNKAKISGGEWDIFDVVLTAPTGAAFLVFNVAASNDYSTEIMIVAGTEGADYQTPKVIPADAVTGLNEKIKQIISNGKLSLTKTGKVYTLKNAIGEIKMQNKTANYSQNEELNFMSWKYNAITANNPDDVAPAHILNTTIGANHGETCAIATITGHGFGNTILGTEWLHTNGLKYYPMRIVDADHIVFLSENQGTETNPSFTFMPTGTLTKGADSMVVSAVSASQLWPSLKNYALTIYADDEEITANGTYTCAKCQLVESYEIVNPSSVLDSIIARAGQSSDPDYSAGNAAALVQNIYQFDANLNVFVISNFVAKQAVTFDDVMFAQAVNIGSNGVTKYYIPNSLPWGTYDFRTPLAVTWSNSVPQIFTDLSHTKDTTKPINRIVQYHTNGIGFALGYVPGVGVGKDLFDFTSETFEVRNNSGKIYPHGANSVVKGTPLAVGDTFNAVMYRCFFETPTSGNRQSMYHFELNGDEYVFIDYKGTMFDNVQLDGTFNGRKISVIESQNAVLQSDIYNNGILVNATYVANETCYIVLRILP